MVRAVAPALWVDTNCSKHNIPYNKTAVNVLLLIVTEAFSPGCTKVPPSLMMQPRDIRFCAHEEGKNSTLGRIELARLAPAMVTLPVGSRH